MKNHMRSSTIVPKGTAPEDACPQMKKLRMKHVPAITPG